MTVIVPLDNPVAEPMLGSQLNVAINNSVPSVQLNLGNGQILQIPIDDFNPELNRLTWTDSSPVSSSGALDFGSQTEPTATSSYIGNYFNGIFYFNEPAGEFPFGGLSYYGEVGQYCYTRSSMTVIGFIEQATQMVANLVIQMYLQEMAIKGAKKIYPWTKEVFTKLFQTSHDMDQQITTAKGITEKFAIENSGENAVVKEGVGESATADTGEIVSEEVAEEATGDEALDIFSDVVVGIFCL